jgi:hypothetical protein
MDIVIYLESAFDAHARLLDWLQTCLGRAALRAVCARLDLANFKKRRSELAFPRYAIWLKRRSNCLRLENLYIHRTTIARGAKRQGSV